jgi:hypothetical protein
MGHVHGYVGLLEGTHKLDIDNKFWVTCFCVSVVRSHLSITQITLDIDGFYINVISAYHIASGTHDSWFLVGWLTYDIMCFGQLHHSPGYY